MKKTIAILIICMLMFAGCKQNGTETSSNTTSVNSISESSSETSSVKKIKKPVSSREESSSEVSSEAVSSKETTSSKPKEKPKEKDDSIYQPAKMERIYNEDTGKYVTLGMTREEVEKVFPPPEDEIVYWDEEDLPVKEHNYKGVTLGYKKGKLVKFETLMYKFEYGKYEDNRGHVHDWEPFNVSLGGKIKYMDDFKKIKNMFGRQKSPTGLLLYFIYREDNKLKVLKNKEKKKLTKKTAGNVFYLWFDEAPEVEGEPPKKNKMSDFKLMDYITYNEDYAKFRDGTPVNGE